MRKLMRPVRNRDPLMLCGSWGCSINCVMQASFPPTHKLFEQAGRVEKRSRAATQIDFVGSSAKILCPMTNVDSCNSAFQYYLYCGVHYDLVPCTVQNRINSIEAYAICAYCFDQNKLAL
uniref:Uncharacterized protein n=1 Tax=Vespula pensylvanica TaxID=30213 RepID=A0A834NR61_VESPE|nr:hypothetical protein H0235_012597 [Vespula pensylvanica]